MESMTLWAAARSRLKKRSSRSTSQKAGGTAREATPLETVPPGISDSAPTREPPAPVEAAASTSTERAEALNLPLQDADTAPVGFGLGRSTAHLGTGTDLLLPPAEMGMDPAQGTVLGLATRPPTESVRSHSPHVLPNQRMPSEAMSCVSSENSDATAPNFDVFTGARIARFDGITAPPLASASPAHLGDPAPERPASAGTSVTAGDEHMRSESFVVVQGSTPGNRSGCRPRDDAGSHSEDPTPVAASFWTRADGVPTWAGRGIVFPSVRAET